MDWRGLCVRVEGTVWGALLLQQAPLRLSSSTGVPSPNPNVQILLTLALTLTLTLTLIPWLQQNTDP